MRYVVMVLLLLSGAGRCLAQEDSFNTLVQDEADNPPNWCRNGQFSSMSRDYRLGRIMTKTPLMSDDDGKSADACPSEDRKACPVRRSIAARADVLVSKKRSSFYCVYNPADDGSGWVREKDVELLAPKALKPEDWIGTWSDGVNRIRISSAKAGLHVEGEAAWYGAKLADGSRVTHEGGMDFTARPKGDRLVLRAAEEGDCAAEIINLGRYLLARDNEACGGMNVRFNSVYHRQR